MEIKLDNELIRKILRDKVINPNLPEKDQVLQLFEYILGQNQRELKQLVYLLLAIDPVCNYQIGDIVKVKTDHLHSWNMSLDKLKKSDNPPDANDCIQGVISDVDPFSESPYTIEFKYSYKVDDEEETKIKRFDQVLKESEIFNKKANAKPLLDL